MKGKGKEVSERRGLKEEGRKKDGGGKKEESRVCGCWCGLCNC